MITRAIYSIVRLNIDNSRASEITDEEVNEITSEASYEFKNYGDYGVDTETCEKNDEGSL